MPAGRCARPPWKRCRAIWRRAFTEFREFQREPCFHRLRRRPKPGLNLSKRSQALRMHRRGEAPEQIAEALELPLQEVDLLLKVHRIVIEAS